MPKKARKPVERLLTETERFAVRMEKIGRIAESLGLDFSQLMKTLQAPTPVQEFKLGGKAKGKIGSREGKSSEGGSAGGSWRETLNLFRSGVELTEIAEQRGLARSTIGGHLVKAIGEGEMKIEEWIDAEAIEKIENVLNQEEGLTLSELKSRLPEEINYEQIRAVIAARGKLI